MPENQDTDRDGQQGNGQPVETLEQALRKIEALEKRVSERDAKLSEYRSQLEAEVSAKKLIEAAQKKQLEEQGNFQELARQRAAEVEALAPYRDRAATLEKVIRESNEARMTKIPETMRALVPMDYPPEKLQSWLNANEILLTKPPAPDFDAGAGGTSGGVRLPTLSPEEKQMAAATGMSEREYQEFKAKRGQPVELKKKDG